MRAKCFAVAVVVAVLASAIPACSQHRRRDETWPHRRHRELRTRDSAAELGQSIADLANAIADLKYGNRIRVANRAGTPVRLYLHYLPRKGGWQTVGHWILQPGEVSFLAHQDQVLRTKNTIFYWFAEEIDGETIWNGPLNVAFEGRTLGMRMYQRAPGRDGVIRLPIDP